VRTHQLPNATISARYSLRVGADMPASAAEYSQRSNIDADNPAKWEAEQSAEVLLSLPRAFLIRVR